MRNYILLICCILNLSMLAQWNPEKNQNELLEYEKYPVSHPNYNNALISQPTVKEDDKLAEFFSYPSTGILTLLFEDNVGPTNVCIYDAFGKCVHEEAIREKYKLEIDLRSQPKGDYVLELGFGNDKAVTKIKLQ